MTTKAKLLLTALCLVLLSAMPCERKSPTEPTEPTEPPAADLDDATLARHASVGPLTPRAARVITDNDAAFAEKLRLVESARSSIDMLYFIFHEDYTSSVLAKALLAAAARGVDVRLVVDYNTNYKDLDLYTMLESEAAAGPGSVQVRLYNRPTRRIVEDAVYMTVGCSEVLAEGRGDCDEQKFDFIERAFAEEEIEPHGLISNLELGHSGLFLSGLYGRRPQAIALAVTEGQDLDFEALKGSGTGGRAKSLKKLAQVYWRSRNGSLFTRVVNRIKLALAYLRYGSEIRELKDTVTSLLPVGMSDQRGGWQDWEFQSDYLHQKLLLIDGQKLLTGGRNIGDSYHMRPNPLLEVPFFHDTEISLELTEDQGREFRAVYDRLWNFRQMVADTAEIRQHAPNDFVANQGVLNAAAKSCANVPEAQQEACVDREFEAGARSLEERQAAHHEEMLHLAAEYEARYSPAPPEEVTADFEVDPGASVYYLENVPYDKNVAPAEQVRLYGGKGLEEDTTGKYLHLVWRRGMTNACLSSSAGDPKRVLLLNPYYLPPAALLRAAGWMVDGTLDCRHVTVQVLTNSFDTNNFNVINALAHMGLKAFSEFYHQQGDPEKRAKFDFYEYRAKPEIPNFTLHSKVSLLGDDVIVGSANCDGRSYMMDANNGILLRGAPGLRDRYTQFLDAQLADPQVVAMLDEYLRSTSREEIKAEKLEQLNSLVATFGVDERLSDSQQATLDKLFGTILDQVYELTHAILRGDEEAIEKYNRLLKFL